MGFTQAPPEIFGDDVNALGRPEGFVAITEPKAPTDEVRGFGPDEGAAAERVGLFGAAEQKGVAKVGNGVDAGDQEEPEREASEPDAGEAGDGFQAQ